MLKLCRDKDCLRFGIAIRDSEFPRNAFYDRFGDKDGLGIYCKVCCRRRTREYRLNMMTLVARTKVKLPATGHLQRVRL